MAMGDFADNQPDLLVSVQDHQEIQSRLTKQCLTRIIGFSGRIAKLNRQMMRCPGSMKGMPP
ncbi:hypothetical protein GCM10023116_09190 [Kistimonas scapharcae]|uniref:Uncharacterized protein n=1 Tax=Kistimonas scapharcae TaxID=1036133 RepID=A0ABP8UZ74_9GAMM